MGPSDRPPPASDGASTETGKRTWATRRTIDRWNHVRHLGRGSALDRHLLPVAFGTFVLLLVMLALRHEPWRDEWQAWVIARDSSSLGDVLHNSRYEGHPPLWYFVLWFASRISRDVVAMQLVNAAIGVATAAVVLWRAPFARAARIAILFGYFPLYQYGTISRSYGLGLMLLVVTLAVAAQRPRRPLAVAVPLGLMILTSAHALLLGAAVAGGLLVDGVVTARADRATLPSRRSVVAASVLLAVCGIVAVLQIMPPSDGGYGVGLSTPSDARSQASPLAPVTMAMFVGRKLLPTSRVLGALATVVGAIVVAAVAWQVRRRPGALTLWLGANALLLGLAWFRYVGQIRHWGHVYLAAIATFWLVESFGEWRGTVPHRPMRWDRVVAYCAILVLSAQVLFGLRAVYKDLRLPYSPTPAAAAWIREHDLIDATLIGWPDEVAMAVAADLDRPMLFLEQDRVGTFVLWRNDRRRVTSREIVTAVEDRLGDGRPVVVVTKDELHGSLGPLRHVGSFDDGIISSEPIELYVAEPNGP